MDLTSCHWRWVGLMGSRSLCCRMVLFLLRVLEFKLAELFPANGTSADNQLESPSKQNYHG